MWVTPLFRLMQTNKMQNPFPQSPVVIRDFFLLLYCGKHMKNISIFIFLFFICHFGAAQIPVTKIDSIIRIDTNISPNTPEEAIAIRAAYNSIDCSNSETYKNETLCERQSLYKNGKIYATGHFKNYRLVCGIQCVYNDEGKLIQIRKYVEGKYIGDAPLPDQ